MLQNINIKGYYEQYLLVEQNDLYLVVNRQEKKVVFRGDEQNASKLFLMLAANFINEKGEIEA